MTPAIVIHGFLRYKALTRGRAKKKLRGRRVRSSVFRSLDSLLYLNLGARPPSRPFFVRNGLRPQKFSTIQTLFAPVTTSKAA